MLDQALNKNPEELRKMASQAVDLGKMRADTKAEDEARFNEAQLAAAQRVAAWEKAMNRAFKGIMPRNVRRAMMMRAAEAYEA